MTLETALPDGARCPCLSAETYGNCCGRFHRGDAHAPTAVRLMRSRFSAFALGDVDYLLATWHPRTRPATLELDAAQRWTRLDIMGASRGGMLDSDGTVEFRAYYRAAPGAAFSSAIVSDHAGSAGSQHEVSRFVRENARWFYLDGAVS